MSETIENYQGLEGFEVRDVREIMPTWRETIGAFMRSPYDCIGRTFDDEDTIRREYAKAWRESKNHDGMTIYRRGRSILLVKDVRV